MSAGIAVGVTFLLARLAPASSIAGPVGPSEVRPYRGPFASEVRRSLDPLACRPLVPDLPGSGRIPSCCQLGGGSFPGASAAGPASFRQPAEQTVYLWVGNASAFLFPTAAKGFVLAAGIPTLWMLNRGFASRIPTLWMLNRLSGAVLQPCGC